MYIICILYVYYMYIICIIFVKSLNMFVFSGFFFVRNVFCLKVQGFLGFSWVFLFFLASAAIFA